MLRRLACSAVVALAVASPAAAAGPSPGVLQGGSGIAGHGGAVRYVAVAAGSQTVLLVVRLRDGSVLRSAAYDGSFGVPLTTFSGSVDGLSADGRTLVLADATPPSNGTRTRSSFLVVATRSLLIRAEIRLRGDFSFDALSPDARTLYLIQHLTRYNGTSYVVRAYDVAAGKLLRRTIADKSQRGWVMAGSPVARTVGVGGRWVYTLYVRPGGTPFVHALDTVARVAHCTGIPWNGDQSPIWKLRLALHDGGRKLAVGSRYVIDTRTWRVRDLA